MRGHDDNHLWLNDFHKFIEASKSPTESVPESLSRSVLAHVRAELSPPLSTIAVKGLVLHVVSSLISLTLCPQFGIGPMGGGDGLMRYFMAFGPNWCFFLCGAFFLGLSAFLTAAFLKREELRLATRVGYAYFPLLAALSYASFLALGANTHAIEIVTSWGIGAILAGWCALKLGLELRCKAARAV